LLNTGKADTTLSSSDWKGSDRKRMSECPRQIGKFFFYDYLALKYGEQYEMDSLETEDEDEETFIEVVSTLHHLRGEQA